MVQDFSGGDSKMTPKRHRKGNTLWKSLSSSAVDWPSCERRDAEILTGCCSSCADLNSGSRAGWEKYASNFFSLSFFSTLANKAVQI